MALTPEDVINKRFQPTKFREGYDQDEVDDFLDEIVVELRRLNQENADLREQLETGGTAPAAQASAPEAEVAPAAVQPLAEEAPYAPTKTDEPQAAAPVETVSAPAETTGAPEQGSSVQSAAGVLAMAQKLHDQYVEEGRAERDRLIAEGRQTADSLVDEAKTNKAQILDTLETEKRGLESSVSGLRAFEASYRERLTDFISGQLREIKDAPALAPEQGTGGSAPRSL